MSKGGFSLVSVLVAAALLAVVLVATITQMQYGRRGQKGLQNSLDFDVLRTSVKLVLDDPDLCDDALRNEAGTARAKFNPTGNVSAAERLGRIVIGTTPVARVGQDLGGGLRVAALDLAAVAGTVPDFTSVPGGVVHTVELTIDADKTDAAGPRRLSNRLNPFRFRVVTDAATQLITTCQAGSANRFLGSEVAYKRICDTSVNFPIPTGALRASAQMQGHGSSGNLAGDAEDTEGMEISVDLRGARSTGFHRWTGGNGRGFTLGYTWKDRAFGVGAAPGQGENLDSGTPFPWGPRTYPTGIGAGETMLYAVQSSPVLTATGGVLRVSHLSGPTPTGCVWSQMWKVDFFGG